MLDKPAYLAMIACLRALLAAKVSSTGGGDVISSTSVSGSAFCSVAGWGASGFEMVTGTGLWRGEILDIKYKQANVCAMKCRGLTILTLLLLSLTHPVAEASH